MRRQGILFFITLLAIMVVVSACGGLAGEPEIVGQMPTQAPASVDPPNTAPDLAIGAQIFAENCVRCHGEIGAGDGEFVQSGQITDIPDFTDPAQHAGRTADEYYAQVTNGNLAKLMPPFSGSLSDQERWSVANYVLTLAGDAITTTAPELPATTEDTTAGDTVTEDTTTSPHGTDTTAEDTTTSPHGTDQAIVGAVSGAVLQGTVGGTVPDSGDVTLSIIDMTGRQSTLTTPLNSDATYTFTDVPIVPQAGYFVSFDYGNGTFTSEFASLTGEAPEINLNITVWDTTDDPSVILINVALTQIDVLDESTLQIWQLVSVTNTSDRLYIYPNALGENVSVEIPAPAGVRLSTSIDISRFAFSENSVFDTVPVIPGNEHSFHLIYTVPYDNTVNFSQSFPYEFSGPYEVYADSSQLKLNGDDWQEVDAPQDIQGVTYRGIARPSGAPANETIAFTIKRNGSGLVIDRQLIGYGIVVLGAIFIVLAGIFYWRNPGETPQPVPETGETIKDLMQEIASLDDKFENGAIKKNAYEKQRKTLKDRVTALMKTEKK